MASNVIPFLNANSNIKTLNITNSQNAGRKSMSNKNWLLQWVLIHV